MDIDDPEPEDSVAAVHHCPPPLASSPCIHSSPCSPSQDRGEEELMMSHALEGLPEWRSPSRSSDWSRRSDVPSYHRSQDEQDLVDAISKRTRAHYSLADMSLDQLETFLQESDEEDYFQNVDDEEEYRKFLAAVQEKVGPEEHNNLEKGIEESESEDEDADFEVEIEEVLESDVEEVVDGIGRKRKRAHRPVTRGTRRKRESVQNKVLCRGRAKVPLRPLLPYTGNVSAGERNRFLAGSASRPWLCSADRHPSDCGFTAHQIGQLFCLMHEHVQLLLQVYAMCVLEPEMQQTAVDTHRMLMELVENREAILSWKISAFPDFCFRPPYIHPSTLENRFFSFQSSSSETPPTIRSRDGLASAPNLHVSSGQTKSIDNAGRESVLFSSSAFSDSAPLKWLPATSGPVRSLTDVAPLALVREFLAAVDQVVQDSREQHLPSENRAPLFAVQLQLFESSKFACELSSTKLKKKMAGAVVGSTNKQIIAVVPRDIASALERFSSLFNVDLFPLKAPPATAANRLLFTDVEDELLAMGLMTYNNDWKAIQERFLPSKSMHQIFVRQKNRSATRAPHNSIKAVRRMKLSPLTADEVACIEEALKVYKYDWIKVCRHCVPYRDPATLPRQWRAAIGTQKAHIPVVNNSNNSNSNNREKLKLPGVRKRPGFAVASQICASVRKGLSQPDEAGSCGDGESEQTLTFREGPCGNSPYMSSATRHLSSESPSAADSVRSPDAVSAKQRNVNGTSQTGSLSRRSGTLGARSKLSRHAYFKFCTLPSSQNHPVTKGYQTVQLAPGLPPLKLPPTVRVLSHSNTELPQVPSIHSCNAKTCSE